MIFIAELARTGFVHHKINTEIIKVFGKVFTNQKLFLAAEKVHANLLTEKLNIDQIRTFQIPQTLPLNPMMKLGVMLWRDVKFFWVYLFVWRTFRKNKNKDDIFLVLSVLPITHLLIKLHLLFVKTPPRFFIVLHGEVENILIKPNFYYRCLQQALRIGMVPEAKYIALSTHIKNNIVTNLHVNANDVLVINHPLTHEVNHVVKNTLIAETKKLILGSVGVHNSLSKRSELIFELAKRFKNEVENALIEFRTVGMLEREVESCANEYVHIVTSNGKMLGEHDYIKQLQELDYFLFFSPESSYKYTASGTFFDAVAFDKPVIAIRNESLSSYQEMIGDFGYLLGSIDDMEVVIRRLLDTKDVDRQAYALFQQNLKGALNLFTVDKIAEGFKKQLEIV